LWVTLASFVAITLCVDSQRVFIVVSVYFIIETVRKLFDTPSYIRLLSFTTPNSMCLTSTSAVHHMENISRGSHVIFQFSKQPIETSVFHFMRTIETSKEYICMPLMVYTFPLFFFDNFTVFGPICKWKTGSKLSNVTSRTHGTGYARKIFLIDCDKGQQAWQVFHAHLLPRSLGS